MGFKHLSLTDLKIKVPRTAHSGVVKKAFDTAEVSEKWQKTAWAKKLASGKKRASLTDFDRFKLKLAKQKKSRILKAEIRKLKQE